MLLEVASHNCEKSEALKNASFLIHFTVKRRLALNTVMLWGLSKKRHVLFEWSQPLSVWLQRPPFVEHSSPPRRKGVRFRSIGTDARLGYGNGSGLKKFQCQVSGSKIAESFKAISFQPPVSRARRVPLTSTLRNELVIRAPGLILKQKINLGVTHK